jgi:hypothetical protein
MNSEIVTPRNTRLLISNFFAVEEIEIALRFAKREIQFLSGGSLEYQYEHQYEIQRIDRLQIGGDVEFIEEVALRYRK